MRLIYVLGKLSNFFFFFFFSKKKSILFLFKIILFSNFTDKRNENLRKRNNRSMLQLLIYFEAYFYFQLLIYFTIKKNYLFILFVFNLMVKFVYSSILHKNH